MRDSDPRRRVLGVLREYVENDGFILRYYYAAELPEEHPSEPFELGYSLVGILLKELGYTDHALISLSGNSITNDLVDQVRRMRARLEEEFGLTSAELEELERLNDESLGYRPVVEDTERLLREVERLLELRERESSGSDTAGLRTA